MAAQLRTWALRLIAGAVVAGLIFWIGRLVENPQRFDAYYARIIILSGIAIILAVSLNLVNGVTGQFSIGHAGFMAVGAYVGAALTVYGQYRFLPDLRDPAHAGPWGEYGALLLAMSAGGLAAALLGFLVGLPSLRLRGDYLAIVTLGFGEIVRVVLLNVNAVGGPAGFSGYTLEGHGRVTIPALTNFFWVYLVVALLVLFSRNLLRSAPGLTFFSVREDEVAAEAMGVNVSRIKVTAFVLSAFFAGVAGALFAHYDTYLKPDTFRFLRSIEIVTMVVMGGMGSISGSIVGAIILTAAPEVMRDKLGDMARAGRLPASLSPDLVRQFLFALLLIVLMLTRPQGIFGNREVSLRGLFARRRRTLGAPPGLTR